jgi:hypothetical protein
MVTSDAGTPGAGVFESQDVDTIRHKEESWSLAG